ncbi:ATP-binding protein OS=Streptomyces alboniger OX=132473 GN=CP975_22010 PE=4 SV=1 [Streptomyces alboniger]
MARHAAPRSPRPGARALLRAGLTLTAAGAAIGAGGATASAAEPAAAPRSATSAAPLDAGHGTSAVEILTGAVRSSTEGGLGPVKSLQLDPLANTSADPLDNSLGTQVADFKPVSTAAVTDPITRGGSLEDLPAVGAVVGLLPG